MAREIVWSRQALEDYEGIYSQIHERGAIYSQRLQKRLMKKLAGLIQFPFSGRRVPELNVNNIRQFSMYRFRVIYVVQEKNIVLGMFFHGSRKMTAAVKRQIRSLRIPRFRKHFIKMPTP